MSDSTALQGSLLQFETPRGSDVQTRVAPFSRWVDLRRDAGVWPYSRTLIGAAGNCATIADEFNNGPREYINYASQDYLGFASDLRIRQVAHDAIEKHGVHSAGSPVLAGRTDLGAALEHRLATILRKDAVALFPTGWAAGFGAVSALVRGRDTILIDALAHNCLQEGARHATRDVVKFKHNDLGALEVGLEEARRRNRDGALIVVTESLFSMDSDAPDLLRMAEMTKRAGAFLILDVAHDFGAMGHRGLGILEDSELLSAPDLVLGSFSKSFSTNGGFVAASREIREHVRFFGHPHVFSNAIGPIQVAIASACVDIAFGDEGLLRRERLAAGIFALRAAMSTAGFELMGTPSPIVPVLVGGEETARITSREMIRLGLQANLVEFPAVPKGRARFRFQVTSEHATELAHRASAILAEARSRALEET